MNETQNEEAKAGCGIAVLKVGWSVEADVDQVAISRGNANFEIFRLGKELGACGWCYECYGIIAR